MASRRWRLALGVPLALAGIGAASAIAASCVGETAAPVYGRIFADSYYKRQPVVLDLTRISNVESLHGLANQQALYGADIVIGPYNEQRNFYSTITTNSYHYGIDILVAEGTEVLAPFDGDVLYSSYTFPSGSIVNENEGIGGVVIMRVKISELLNLTEAERQKLYDDVNSYAPTLEGQKVDYLYLQFMHLSRDSANILATGETEHTIGSVKYVTANGINPYSPVAVRRGDLIGRVGAVAENGGWAPHVHFQVVNPLVQAYAPMEGSTAVVANPSDPSKDGTYVLSGSASGTLSWKKVDADSGVEAIGFVLPNTDMLSALPPTATGSLVVLGTAGQDGVYVKGKGTVWEKSAAGSDAPFTVADFNDLKSLIVSARLIRTIGTAAYSFTAIRVAAVGNYAGDSGALVDPNRLLHLIQAADGSFEIAPDLYFSTRYVVYDTQNADADSQIRIDQPFIAGTLPSPRRLPLLPQGYGAWSPPVYKRAGVTVDSLATLRPGEEGTATYTSTNQSGASRTFEVTYVALANEAASFEDPTSVSFTDFWDKGLAFDQTTAWLGELSLPSLPKYNAWSERIVTRGRSAFSAIEAGSLEDGASFSVTRIAKASLINDIKVVREAS